MLQRDIIMTKCVICTYTHMENNVLKNAAVTSNAKTTG